MSQVILKEQLLDQLEKYQSIKLEEIDSKDFRSKFTSDLEMQDYLKSYAVSKEVIELKIGSDLKLKMKDWNIERINSNFTAPKLIKINWLKWSAAATIALLLGTIAVQYQIVKAYPDKMMIALLQSPTGASRGEETNEVLHKIIFESKTETEIINKLSALSSTDSNYSRAQLLLGEKHVKSGNCDAAKEAFNNSGFTGELYVPVAEILCLLKADKSGTILQSKLDQLISDQNHLHHKNAIAIKKKTTGFWWRIFN